jgi:hypothetical protein
MKDTSSDQGLGLDKDNTNHDLENSSASPEGDKEELKGFGDTEKRATESSHTGDEEEELDGDNSSLSSSSAASVPHRRGSRPGSRTRSLTSVSEVRDGIQSVRDLEMGHPIEEKVTTTAPNPDDPDLVTWTGPDDPENPKNWAFSTKWGAVFIVSVFTFISPVSSSMVAPSLTTIGEELNIPPGFEQAIVLSIFILAYAVGPLLYDDSTCP